MGEAAMYISVAYASRWDRAVRDHDGKSVGVITGGSPEVMTRIPLANLERTRTQCTVLILFGKFGKSSGGRQNEISAPVLHRDVTVSCFSAEHVEA